MQSTAIVRVAGDRPATPLSKSIERALGCELYFAGHYLSDEPAVRLLDSSGMAQTGTDFHAYRAAYIDHLVASQQRMDPDWVVRHLGATSMTDDARDLALRDAESYSIDPDLVYGTEVYLSVDETFRPLDCITGATPGRSPVRNPLAFAHATLDLLQIDGDEARIDDYKTGYSTQNVRPYEPAHQAAMVLAHFPVNRVTFRWEFIRAKASRPLIYERADLDWIHPRIVNAGRRYAAIRAKAVAGLELSVNPMAGNCGYCQLSCPIRDGVRSGLIAIAPLQTEADARTLATSVYVAEQFAKVSKDALKSYLDSHPAVELGNGFVVEMVPTSRNSYSLSRVLALLGFGSPETSAQWDVPLKSVGVSATDLHRFAGAKKRAGMRDALEGIANRTPYSELKIHKAAEREDAA